jgi:hypothetical protein
MQRDINNDSQKERIKSVIRATIVIKNVFMKFLNKFFITILN